MKKFFTFIIVFIMSFMFMKGNVFAAFTATLESSEGHTAKYKITSSVKYTSVAVEPGVGIASANLVWNADGISGTLTVTFSSSDCKGEVKLKYDKTQGCDNLEAKDCEAIIADARSMVGKIPYEMAGKCAVADFTTCAFDRIWTGAYPTIQWVTSSTPGQPPHRNKNLTRHGDGKGHTGLDCSGFVWWLYFRNGYNLVRSDYQNYYHTSHDPAYSSAMLSGVPNIASNSDQTYKITKEEAKPCDLVTSTKPDNSSIPHVGIITSTPTNGGSWLFVHENGSDDNVAENAYFENAPAMGKAVYYWRVKALWEGSSESDSSETCSGNDTLTLDNSEYCSCDHCDHIHITDDYLAGDSVINNCCLKGDSHLKEYSISELFCSTLDADMKIKYYHDQCNNELYKDDAFGDINEDPDYASYCKVFCTEEMDLKVPKQIESATGKFFKLQTLSYNDLDGNPHDTKAPVIKGTKTCTIKINYKAWRDDYETVIKDEIAAFNSLQQYLALYELVRDAKKEPKNLEQTVNVNCKAKVDSYRKKTAKAANGSTYTKSDGSSGTCASSTGCDDYEKYTPEKCEPVTCTNKYYEYTIKDSGKLATINCSGDECSIPYYNVKANTSFDDKTSYDGLRLTTVKLTAKHEKVTAYPYENGCDAAIQSKIDELSSDWNCETPATLEIPEGETKLDMEAKAEEYAGDVQDYKEQFSGHAASAETYEKIMIKCQDYFLDEQYAAKPSSDYFQLKPRTSFNYVQVFLDNKKPMTEWNEINYGDATCEYRFKNEKVHDIDCETESDSCVDQYYSPTVLKSESETLQDLVYSGNFVTAESGIPKDEAKTIEKKLRQDAQYDAQCHWDDPEDHTEYSLYPGPQVKDTIADYGSVMITGHKYQYALYVVTYQSKYETYWKLEDIGGSQRTKDKFIKAFNDAGGTCADPSINEAFSDGKAETHEDDNAKVTCVINVLDGGMRIGTCESGWGPAEDKCHENNIKEVFEFRVVDPKDMFPGNDSNWVDKADNWKRNPGTVDWGPTYQQIHNIAQDDKTYAPENLSYSFKLNSKSIRALKSYNDDHPYDDFTLTCTCPNPENPDEIDTYGCGTIDDDVKNNPACVETDAAGKKKWIYTCRNCHSNFLREFAVDGVIESTTLDRPAWNNTIKSFDDVRNDKSRWA